MKKTAPKLTFRSRISIPFLIGVPVIVVGSLYASGLPSTIQIGDTAELVRGAYAFEVIHPPGYPLFLLLLGSFLRTFTFGTFFWRAAVFTAALGVAACTLMAISFRKIPVLSSLLGLSLGTSYFFWRYSVLPDVFTLHCVLVLCALLIYFDEKLEKLRYLLPAFLVGCLAHHLTIIFLAPLAIDVLISEFRNRKLWICAVCAGAVVICIYGVLGWMHPDSMASWGRLDTVEAIAKHFLRYEVGVLKLVGTNETGSKFANLLYVWQETCLALSVPLILGLFVFGARVAKGILPNRKELCLVISILLYGFGFFAMANMELTGFRVEAMSRFFILLHLLLIFWVGTQFKSVVFKKWQVWGLASLLVAGVTFNVRRNYQLNDFSRNTIVEDDVINLLNHASSVSNGRQTIALIKSDSRYFGAQYAQTVMGLNRDLVVLNPNLLSFGWYRAKARDHGLQVPESFSVIDRDLIFPNLDKANFFTQMAFENAALYKITIVPMGRILQAGAGIEFQDVKMPDRVRSDFRVLRTSPKEYDPFREIWSDYGIYPMTLGRALELSSRYEEALTEYSKVLELVPWHVPAKMHICLLLDALKKDSGQCKTELAGLIGAQYPYFEKRQ